MKPMVYLAGPMSGLSYQDAADWRVYSSDYLAQHGIVTLDPMRGTGFLGNMTDIPNAVEDAQQFSPAAVTARDRWDCMRASLVLMNLLGATSISVGTCIEMGWCDMNRTPVVLVMEKNGLHEHPILSTVASFRTGDLTKGLEMVVNLLKGK